MHWLWPFLFAVGYAAAQESPAGVQPDEAWRDSGKTETVCGQVVDTSYALSVKNASTYLYLEKPRPEQVFTVIIPAAQHDLFGEHPEESFRGKHICVTGKIAIDPTDRAGNGKHRATTVIEEEDQLITR